MSEPNIYSKPESIQEGEIFEVDVRSSRLNRINFISSMLLLWLYLPTFVSAILIRVLSDNIGFFDGNSKSTGGLLGIGNTLDLLEFWYFQIPIHLYFCVKRTKDIGWNPFLSLILGLPLINLILCFWPGTKGQNAFGKPTPVSSILTKLFVFTSPLTYPFVFFGMMSIALAAAQYGN